MRSVPRLDTGYRQGERRVPTDNVTYTVRRREQEQEMTMGLPQSSKSMPWNQGTYLSEEIWNR